MNREKAQGPNRVKKIKVDQLRTGMYIHDLNCGWMDHPFLSGQFALTSQAELDKILSLGVRELYIDTSRGGDIGAEERAVPHAVVQEEIHARLEAIATEVEIPSARVAREQEYQRAKQLHSEANHR